MDKQKLENEFIALVETYQRVIYKVCYIYSKDNDNLNDLYQESILNLWKSFPKFQNECKTSTWIYRITLNTCVSFFRRFSRAPKFVPLSTNLEIIAENEDELTLIHELYHLINHLGDLEKAIILLHLEKRSYQEIADITGLSLTNVATRINRIKDKLKRMSNK
ncbi:MAG TPA: sigma-70 family RNA polymerase sigma factor [Butyricimonas virosa]|uniref:Sigma-70 family RNA polymerase sigma factor n=1 Tax=Butyricimonas virosa TaxID=544645 RepID=A0A921H6A1_9BACT|nr:sigma-70 family RNA polymerase sigma factor [Butyricimonas virosa]